MVARRLQPPALDALPEEPLVQSPDHESTAATTSIAFMCNLLSLNIMKFNCHAMTIGAAGKVV